MFGSAHPKACAGRRPATGTPWSGTALRALVGALAAAVLLTGVALAAKVAPTVSSARNAALHKTIVVDSRGRTVYVLSPETVSHLLCTSSACFAVWPPMTVSSRTAKLMEGLGVHGHLALLRRSNGVMQVTLRGLPLYRYAGDSARGQANGEGIKSFGGTWHAVPAA